MLLLPRPCALASATISSRCNLFSLCPPFLSVQEYAQEYMYNEVEPAEEDGQAAEEGAADMQQ